MKQILLYILTSLVIVTFMTACSGQMADKMAVVGTPSLSSDPCAAIDKKVMRLDRFTEVVKNTSAFHLEEKATALPVPGITVSNNRKQMLREAKKKYAEYAAERQKYACETPVSTGTAQIVLIENPPLSSDRCTAIDKKLMRLDRFTEVVKNTSAFHLEEKATALPVPGITVSNNRKQMLRAAKRKYAEYAAEHQRYNCETPIPTHSVQRQDKREVVHKPVSVSESSTDSDKKMMKPDESTTKVTSANTVDVAEKVTAVPLPGVVVTHNKEQTASDEKKKDAEDTIVYQKESAEPPMVVETIQVADTKEVAGKSDLCDALDEELIKLYEFTIMVNTTSAFHLQEKASALPSPGFTVSNNKKKMLKDAEKKRVELLAERQKHGCETAEKK
ncbi:hypothetical protein MN086_08675 [Sulfurovum sp. XGS-02]|uniref:hypothetical protein n=1 Tax=Sulfurovum sp. XGS-02 TaxID=2925411 RepID=UPI00206E55B3|nr:hypothetical protein [Sulfurovum sp. XGS-02]UPT77122.1 hypothetical protein MN086_08675 [Sulfurovum sp. XGS-02]